MTRRNSAEQLRFRDSVTKIGRVDHSSFYDVPFSDGRPLFSAQSDSDEALNHLWSWFRFSNKKKFVLLNLKFICIDDACSGLCYYLFFKLILLFQ